MLKATTHDATLLHVICCTVYDRKKSCMQHVALYMIGKKLHATCCTVYDRKKKLHAACSMMLHELERDSIPFAMNIINRCFY